MTFIDRLCRGVRPSFSDHLDGEPVPLHVAVQLRLHLTFCPMCRRTYRALQTNRDSLAALRELDVQDTEVSSKSTNPNDTNGR
jgi:predicted anti-sigma-YlaC factor YlaD